MSRITGWTAHIIEQFENNSLIRPLSAYNGPEERPHRALDFFTPETRTVACRRPAFFHPHAVPQSAPKMM